MTAYPTGTSPRVSTRHHGGGNVATAVVGPLDRSRIWTAAAIAVVVAAALAAWGTWGGDADHSTGDYLIVLAVIAVSAAIVYGLVLPRWGTPRTGIILGVLAALSIVVFWSGLPIVLGIAAIVIGLSFRSGNEDSGPATVALALGALALVGSVVVYIMDMS